MMANSNFQDDGKSPSWLPRIDYRFNFPLALRLAYCINNQLWSESSSEPTLLPVLSSLTFESPDKGTRKAANRTKAERRPCSLSGSQRTGRHARYSHACQKTHCKCCI